MTLTITSTSLPFLAKPSTGWDLFSKPPEKPTSYPHISEANDDDPTVGPRRAIASRGTEIFVARGNEVRVADLQDLKARQPAQHSVEGYREYKRLDLPELDFDICQLEISKDGVFLAIIGENELAVCVLPAEGLSKMENPKLRVPAFHKVGENVYNKATFPIVRVLWHPLGVDDASLVVLSKDGMIRSYDFKVGRDITFSIADQEIDLYLLSGRARYSNGFSADESEMEPASCCFGEGAEGWRRFTLYILMRGGDIYALTPLVPSRWMASRECLQKLSLSITADLESIDQDASLQEKLILRQQTKWINDILTQETNLENSFGASQSTPWKKNQTYLTRPGLDARSKEDLLPHLQGPFLFQPPPVEFPGDYYACDIFHTEAGSLGVIGILYSNGKVDICLEFELLRAKWVDKKKRHQEQLADLPVIAAFESIDLGLNAGRDNAITNWPVFVPDPRSEQVWFVNHNSGVVSFSMKGWLNKLSAVLDREEDPDFMTFTLEKSPQSTVSVVLDNRGKSLHPNPAVGSVVIYEAYLGYIFVAATLKGVAAAEFDEVLAAGSRSSETIAKAEQLRMSTSASQRSNTLSTSTQRKMNILLPPYNPSVQFRQRGQLAQLLQQVLEQNPRLVRSPVVFSTESNEFLRKARDALKLEYDGIMEAAQEMYDRAALQRIEYRKQIETIHRADEQLAKIQSKDVRERLERYLKRQEELQSRADEVLKLLIVKSETGLSDAEKKWFKEVGKIEERVVGEGRVALAARKEMVARMMDELKPLVEGGKGSGLVGRKDDVPESIREEKLRILRELLDREDVLVKSTRKKLENLTTEVEQVQI
ncbi:hypothetical protein DFP73DRAFT_504399 [Morchella snyderi]|nr:hypothetical protein DFP73DRAFT_504399 [Morchella snyderi]